jgi:hypothetical protein
MTASAADRHKLVGAWRLVSFVVEDVSTRRKIMLYGEHPRGYLLVLPSGRMAAIITSETRTVPMSAEESQVAYQSMNAFSGKYRVENGKLITSVDVASHESWVGTEQVRLFRVEGETLHLERPAGPSPDSPKITRTIASWVKEK